MFLKLLMLFTVVPLVELYVLIKVGEKIGTVNTIGIVLLTGIVGASFARTQGSMALARIRDTLVQGQIPGRELVGGAMILAGGVMLVTPGIITDIVGLSLIFPLTRNFYTDIAVAFIQRKFQSGKWQFASRTTIHTDVLDEGEQVEDDEIHS